MIRSLFLALCALSALAIESPIQRPQQSLRFPINQFLVYDYESRLMTGIPQLKNQYAGLEIRAKVILQALSDSVVAMKMTQIRVGKHNGQVQDGFPAGPSPVIDHAVHAQFQQQLQKPIRFVYSAGKVKAFEADQSEPEWSLNMKKAFLSLLNVDLQPKKIIRAQTGLQKQNLIQRAINTEQLSVYPVYEEGIGGLCETVYELNNAIDPQSFQSRDSLDEALVLNVTKTRNYDNCLTEPTIVNDNYDVRGCPWVCRKEKSFSAVAGYYPVPDAVQDPYMSGCPCGKEPHESPVDAYAFAKYNISLAGGAPLIEGVYAEGKTAYKNNGAEILVITQQNLTIAGQALPTAQLQIDVGLIARPQRHNELTFRIPKPQSAQKTLDIPYYHLFGPIDAQELQNLIPELLDSLASQIAAEDIVQDSQKIGQNSVQMVNAMAVLSQHQLEQLFDEVALEGASLRATPKQQVMRKLFLDALPLSGSNEAALAIKQLILAQKLTTQEAKEAVEAVPQNLFLIDTETIDQYLELFQAPKVQQQRHLAASTGIAFAKMVKEACVKRQTTPGDIPDQPLPHPKRNLPAQMVVQEATPSRITIQKTAFSQRMRRSAEWEEQFTQDVCSQSDVTKYVTIVARLLQQANQFHKKVTLIETLAHMGVPQALPFLEPYISGSAAQSGQCPGYVTESERQNAEECDFVRQVAIYALTHIAENYPKQVLPLVAKVYGDQSEAYEVRIAAFTTLIFAAPDKPLLERIASQLHQENSRQVKSFVYSALHTVANISAPCFQHVSQHAQQAVQHAPHSDYGYQYSKMIGDGFFDQQKDFGLYAVAEWTQSNVSRVPRAAYFSIGQSSGPFQEELLQIGFQAKGVEQLIARALEPNGIIQDMFEGMHAKGRDRRLNKRNADSAQQLMEALKSKLNLKTRSDDEAKATIFFKLFDRTSYYALDKHYIHQLIDEAEDQLKDIAQALMAGQQYHYVKLVMPSQLYKVVPSELGLPVVISHRHPIILSLKVDQAKLQVNLNPRTVFPIGANVTAQVTPSLFYSSHTFAFAVSPADKQAYGTHVQKTTHAQFPAEVSVGYSRPKNLVTWSVIPKTNEGQNQEIFFQQTKSQTFVAKTAVSGAPDSDWLQNAEEIETMAAPFQYEQRYGQESGLGVRVQVQSESAWSEQPIRSGEVYEQYGTVAALVQSWRNPGLKAREVHVQLEQDSEEPVQGYDFTLRYKWTEDAEEEKDADDSDESSASDESDSDDSDASSESQSSESNSSESNSAEDKEKNAQKKDKSSASSEESDESNESKATRLKKKIARRMNKAIQNERQRRSAKKESNESSDESSNESGSQSNSKSGSQESSQSSSSESGSSEENKSKSKSAKSSESASSSSESDESTSFEDEVFTYEDVMRLILGQDFQKKSIQKITKKLIRKTADIWKQNWDEDYDQSSSDESAEDESALIPQTISHDIAITAVARGPRPTFYAANALYAHTYDHRIQWIKTDGYIKAPKGVYMTVPTLFCADAVVSYPTIPNEFYFEPQMASQAARIQAQMGWGAQCQTEGGVIVKGVIEQTDDHVVTEQQFAQQEGSSAQVQNWFYSQCNQDRQNGQSQSYACQRAIIASSFFNQLILDIKYKNVPEQIQNFTQKLDLALKVALYDYADVSALSVHNPQNQIRVRAQYSQRIPDTPLANIEILSPNQNVSYERVHVPYVRPISALYPIARVFENLVTGYESRAECHVMEDFIRTFDNVTFQLPDSPCQYLLAKDCSAHERFAVFIQQLEAEVKTKTVTILASGSEIKLLPPQQQNVAQILVDGRAHELTYRQPITLQGDKNSIRVYLRATPSEANNPIVVFESDVNSVQVLYDGKSAKVVIPEGQYRGKTCGLCGDNNQETEEEFSGPEECVYDEAEDFANSYALSGQHCEQKSQPKGLKRCPQSQYNELENAEQIQSVKTIESIGPNGQTTIVRQQLISGQIDDQQRAQQLQANANQEELGRQQQQMQERQMARQGGEPLSAGQQQTLIGGSAQTQKLIQRLRTYYLERDEMVCFTTKPVLSCVQNYAQASAWRQLKADFHCLPKSTQFTQQLIQEAQTHVIKQLANKRVDLRQEIRVPVACVAI